MAASAAAASDAALERRSQRLVESLKSVQESPRSRIPTQVLEDAQGIIILRQQEAGFVLGGKGGFGVAMIRDLHGNWGPPAWIKTSEGSGGLQIGYQKLNVVILLMDEKALTLLYKPKFQLGVDAVATAGPLGANFEATTGYDSPILIYTNTDGLFAGAAFQGGFLIPDRKANIATYNGVESLPRIIAGRKVETPRLADKLHEALREMENSSL